MKGAMAMFNVKQLCSHLLPCRSLAPHGSVLRQGCLQGRLSLLSLLAVVLMFCPLTGRTQELSATITGSVTDTSGAVIPHAAITITLNGVNGTARVAVSDASGNFTATNLPAGTYSVTAASPGFETYKGKNIVLDVAEKHGLNIELKAGSANTTVTVEDNPVSVNTETSGQAGTISGLQIKELEINSRNFVQLVTLQPGVVNMLGDEASTGFTAISVNGARGTANNWTVDGADINDSGSNTTAVSQPSMEAINEITLERGNYDAGYGRSGGGQILVATRSGTSSFHGEGYEYVRTTDFNANDWLNKESQISQGLANEPGVYHQNVYGFTFGGPAYIPKFYNTAKNKTFFFWSEDWHKIDQAGSSETLNPPTTAESTPDAIGNYNVPGKYTPPSWLSPSAAAAEAACVNYSAATDTTAIASTCLSKNSAVYLTNLFKPNANASGVLVKNEPSKDDYRDDIVRIDHYFNDRLHFFARGMNDTSPTIDPDGLWNGAQYPGAANAAYNSPGKNVVGNLTWAISPTVVNELEFAWAQGTIDASFVGGDFANSTAAVSALQPNTTKYTDPYGRMPGISITGITGFAPGSVPYKERNLDRTYFDNLALSFGKNTIRMGFQLQQMIKNENATGGDASFSFNSFGDFLLGNVNGYGQASRDTVPNLNYYNREVYVQDDWKLSHRLTLNLGLRWSSLPSPTDKNNTLTNFDPLLYSSLLAPVINPTTGTFQPGQNIGGYSLVANTYANGLIFPTLNGHCAAAEAIAPQVQCSPYGNYVNPNDNDNFAPRVGFAFNPDGRGTTAIRGGFGVFYDRVLNGMWENNAFDDPPITQNATITNTAFDAPLGAGTGSSPDYGPNSLTATGTPTFRVPNYFDYNLTVEHQILPSTVLSVAYVGNQARHLVGEFDQNQPTVAARLAAAPGTDVNAIRPYAGYSFIQDRAPLFTSNYNSLQVTLNHRSSHGLTVGGSYTYSKVLTTNSTDRSGDLGASFPSTPTLNTHDMKADYGPASFDQPQSLIFNYVYVLPFYKHQDGFTGKTLGGWELSGITTIGSGTPMTLTQAEDPFACTNNPSLPNGAGACKTNTVPGRGLGIGNAAYGNLAARLEQIAPVQMFRKPGQWFSQSSYTWAGNNQFGNVSTGSMYGPRFQKWDVALAKNTSIGEYVKFQLRVEAFNIANHPNFNQVNPSIDSPSFGTVTTDHEPRLLQMGGKFTF
jgi:Carboxypeptidase regulatory-like domain/TonB-dependent Receptor Plug Domain